MGVNNKIIMKFVNRFIAQSRKADNETWMTAQRYNDIPRRMRAQIDRILIPVKKHEDGSLCYQDKCKRHHWIEVYSDKPYRKTPISLIDTWVIGKYYDTNEIITDELIG
jgi:hypothetical protein